MGNYLDKLNPEQRKAVQHINGPLMVIAGAGSGKTRVLTYRIVHLLKNNVSPFNILSLTFTNKAGVGNGLCNFGLNTTTKTLE